MQSIQAMQVIQDPLAVAQGGTVWNGCFYGRLSCEDGDKEESDSISNQRALVHDYINANMPDVHIVDEFIDDGYSGASFERPFFQKMEEAIRAGRINCVIVKDLSRFGRNFTEAGRYLEQIFPFLGVRFISVNDRLDSMNQKTSGDRIIVPFKNLINDAYCRDISIKIRSQLDIKRKKGDFIGSFAVYGYLKDEKNRNALVIDDFAADIVRAIFKWKIEGLSQQGIANRLNEMGALSPMEYKKSIGLNYASTFKVNSKAKWSAVAVGRILSNEIYIGVMVQGKRSTPNHKVKKYFEKPKDDWVRAYDTHAPIISREDFELANNLLLKDLRISPGQESVFIFSGIGRCSDCGMNMVRKTVPSGGQKYFYYVCKNSKTKNCTPHSISEKLLEESVLLALQTHIGNVRNLEQVLAFIDTLPIKQEEVQRIDRQLIKVNEEISRYRELKISLYESMISGIIDEDEYTEMKASYTRKCDEAEKSALRLSGEIEKLLANKGEKCFWIESFKAHSNIAELSRKVVVTLIDEITVYEGNRIGIKFKYRYNYESAINFVQSVSEIMRCNTAQPSNADNLIAKGAV
ncbi:MAG: recombinase family protein [Defluviitaleaceae bacterium]|nr:recombinase family protein [Defluviitaleaceae bacterium]